MEDLLTAVLQVAIAFTKRRQGSEVESDDVLAACLLSISRFGIARLGDLVIDLESLDIDWMHAPVPGERKDPKVAYAESTVARLDGAWAICRASHQTQLSMAHLLAAFASPQPAGLMAKLSQLGIDSAAWRAGIAAFDALSSPPNQAAATNSTYLSPEQAAEFLGVHHQTIRGYIRAGKLSALRIAGERAVRIRREDLQRLLEPLATTESE